MPHPKRPAPRRQRGRRADRGVVLLEALVGILIFTIGVLGLIGLQAAMTRAQTAANYRAEAAQLASDIVGRMWIDTPNLASYTSTASCQSHAPCKNWMLRVARLLPGGIQPTITKTGDRYDIVITWVVPGESDGGGKHSFSTYTAISL